MRYYNIRYILLRYTEGMRAFCAVITHRLAAVFIIFTQSRRVSFFAYIVTMMALCADTRELFFAKNT